MTSQHHHHYDGLFLKQVHSNTKFRYTLLLVLCCFTITFLQGCWTEEKESHRYDESQTNIPLPELCTKKNEDGTQNIITAEVVALEQIITFNRFGAFNPAGMVYALRKDVVDDKGADITSKTDAEMAELKGKVRLRETKRPRPLVLRVHEGECLQVKFWNLLSPLPTIHTTFQRADFPEGGVQRHAVLETPADNPNNTTEAKANDLSTPPRNDPNAPHKFPFPRQEEPDYPTTRSASIHVNGLDYANIESDGANVGNNPSSLAEPGTSKTYTWYARQEGGYFFYSAGALAGGEGDGGQLGLGLFGSINVEPKGSIWYRSQVVHKDLVDAAGSDTDYSKIDYEDLAIVKNGVIQHSDLNAIIYQTDKTNETPEVCSKRSPGSSCGMSFREFTTIFHDENKVFQAFAELSDEGNPISAIADGMAINYGSSGVGSVVLANRKHIGPGKDCPDCKLEEFFLSSWVNGDPAMIVRRNIDGKEVEALYPEDPSNVHHSYLGDPVRFRNIHAGPKETHVFHLHAHQWLQDKNDPNANYLDSQTISPGSSYTYDIQYGGGGNRNLTVGDAIFHCHLYPHFAAGMWELWRNHDVFEDGKPGLYDKNNPDPRLRNLPDSEIAGGSPNPAIVPIPGFPLAPLPTAEFRGYPFFMAAEPGHRPPQPPMDMARNEHPINKDDKWLDGGLPRHIIKTGTNKEINVDDPQSQDAKELLEGFGDRDENTASRYVAKRTWQLNSDPNNLKLAKVIESATVKILPQCGTQSEILAMAYHAGWKKKEIEGLKLGNKMPTNMLPEVWEMCKDEFVETWKVDLSKTFEWNYIPEKTEWPKHTDPANPQSPWATMNPLWTGKGFETANAAYPKNHPASIAYSPGNKFRINGFAPAQGAPFADPCPTEYYEKANKSDELGTPVNHLNPRIYKSAYIQFDMTVNKYGWHDPQARMPVLEEDAAKTLDGTRLAEPLFFRANSGDCIQFQATNLIPSVLNLDDFQVYSPTDTIGQHIHLVKFDVIASDGSANGWNYEDGTFSPDEVRERIDASHHVYVTKDMGENGKVIDWQDQPVGKPLKAKTHPMFVSGSMKSKSVLGTCTNSEKDLKEHPWCGAQTTVQRWWADPVLNDQWHDRTMRAVFTHDHYGPSSHQQHGFYAALIVEPKDTVWTTLNASSEDFFAPVPDKNLNRGCDKQFGVDPISGEPILKRLLGGTLEVNESPIERLPIVCNERKDGGPTSYAANIMYPNNEAKTAEEKKNIRREYNLAFADFAILYNADLRPVNPPSRQADLMLPHVVRDGLKPKPEGISTEDPGTRLLNYRNEPIPLRIAEEDQNSLEYKQKAVLTDGNGKGDMANVFSTVSHMGSKFDSGKPASCEDEKGQKAHAETRFGKLHDHVPNEIIDENILKGLLQDTEKDRCTFIKHIYESEPWRDPKGGDPSTPVLAAYEGDHLQLQLIQGAQEEQHVFSMNGMKWLAEPLSPNSGYMNGQQIGISEHFEFDVQVTSNEAEITDHLYGSPAVENLWDGMWGLMRAFGLKPDDNGEPRQSTIEDSHIERIVPAPPILPSVDATAAFCPKSEQFAPRKPILVTAWLAADLLSLSENKVLTYNKKFGITDPNAIIFVEIDNDMLGIKEPLNTTSDDIEKHIKAKLDNPLLLWGELREKYSKGKPVEPLVLRATAGSCIKAYFVNFLPKTMIDGTRFVSNSNEDRFLTTSWSYNLMPPIVNGFNFNQVQMSSSLGLHPQLLAYNVLTSDASNIGMNDSHLVKGCTRKNETEKMPYGEPDFETCSPGNTMTYTWYAGDRNVSDKAGPENSDVCIYNKKGEVFLGTEQINTNDPKALARCKKLDEPINEREQGRVRFTPMEFGAVSIRSFGDVIKQSSHGAVGMLIVEPRNSTWELVDCDPRIDCGLPKKDRKELTKVKRSKTMAIVKNHDTGELFHEFALIVQDDLSLLQNGQPMPNHRMADDAEDTGQKGFNYGTEPLWARNGVGTSGADFNELNRVDYTNTLSSIYANPGCGSKQCNDPETPVFSAPAKSNVRFRLVHPGGHSRQHAFVIYGHNWDYQPWADNSSKLQDSNELKTSRVGAIGGIGPARHTNILVKAGGQFGLPGDYLFRVQEQFQFQGGMWGIFRVEP